MLKRALKWGAGIAAALFAALLVALGWVHSDIRSADPALPAHAAVLAPSDADVSSWPVRIRYINTASQAMSRAMVLEASADPNPDLPYVLSHAAFVLEWADGRLFLIDTGLPGDAAIAFGRPAELLGAEPTRTHGGVTVQLGPDARRLAGIAFTHLHPDHTSGLANLCDQRKGLGVFQAPLQFERGNYTTRTSQDQIASASCATRRRLEGGPFFPIPGFPGLFAIQAAGHTPGSQLFVAHLPSNDPGGAPQTWVFTGDVVNHIDGVRENVPKPSLYSLLLVPESPEQLERVRRFLQTLESEYGVRLLVSHDQLQVESSGIEKWR